MLVYGGSGAEGAVYSDIWMLDGALWRSVTVPSGPVPGPRTQHRAVDFKGSMVITGGSPKEPQGGAEELDRLPAWAFNVQLQSWEELLTLPALSGHSAATLGDTIFLCGGTQSAEAPPAQVHCLRGIGPTGSSLFRTGTGAARDIWGKSGQVFCPKD